MRVLVPFNGSDSSWKAINYALEMARKNTLMRITIIAVASKEHLFMSANMTNNPVSIVNDFYNYLVNQTQQVEELFSTEKIKINVILKQGEVSNAILETVEQLSIDQMVVGRGKISFLKDIIFGNSIYRVLSAVKIPVTLIR